MVFRYCPTRYSSFALRFIWASLHKEVYWITCSPVEHKEWKECVIGVSSVPARLAARSTRRVAAWQTFQFCQQSVQFVTWLINLVWCFAFIMCVVTYNWVRGEPSPSARGFVLNKWPPFIYVAIPVRRQPSDGGHIMYHSNAYALWLIRLLIWGGSCGRTRALHWRLCVCE